MRAQSCSGWYLRSDGYDASAKVLALLAVERLAADLGGPRLSANVDLERRAGLGLAAGEVRHADALVQARRERPARDLAAAHHRVALARDAGPRQDERDELLRGAAGALLRNGLGADEPRVLLAAPAEPRLDGAARLHEVVAVEVEADLEPQGVAGAEADRGGALLRQGVPHARGVLGSEQQLDAILARIARPGNEDVRGARDLHPRRPEPTRQLRVREPLDQPAGLGSLDGEHRVVVQAVVVGDVEAVRVPLEPGEVLLVVRRVRDGEEAVGPEPVGEEVVEDAAVGSGEHGVLGAVVRDLRDVVGEDALEQPLGAGALRLDLAHVADVEHADRPAHGDVLGPDARVLDRHLPARERDELGAGGHMPIVQRGALERVGARGHRGRTLAAVMTPPGEYIPRAMRARLRASPRRASAYRCPASGALAGGRASAQERRD